MVTCPEHFCQLVLSSKLHIAFRVALQDTHGGTLLDWHFSSGLGLRGTGLSLRLWNWVAGAQLLRFDIRKPGIICVPRVIHSLPEGDAFVALAPLHQRSSAAQAQQGQHLLAASTLDCIMLMDLRRPGQALLKWPHGAIQHPTS